MKHKNYLVKLTPLDRFFFGNERTLSFDNADYLVKSSYWPQQTALLGVLRYKILEMKNWLAGKGKRVPPQAKAYIGETNFRVNKKQDYGHIHGLSFAFLVDGKTRYFAAPFDYGMSYVKKASGGFLNKEFIPHIQQGYTPKEGIPFGLISSDNVFFKYENIFFSTQQTGIRKDYGGVTLNNAFYKQYFYKFKKRSVGFAFVASLNEATGDALAEHCGRNSIIQLGGESSLFKIQFDAIAGEDNLRAIPDVFKNNAGDTNLLKATLLSDAYCEADIYDSCEFAISETCDFRHIQTVVDKTDDYDGMLSVKESAQQKANGQANTTTKLRKSKKYNLLQKGSVFFLQKEQKVAFINALTRQKESWMKIGYNAFSMSDTPSINYINTVQN